MNRFTKQIMVFSCLLFSAGLFGQSYVGAFAGLNSSKLSGDTPNKADYKSIMGANLGAFVDIKLGKSLWLSLQPSYSQEGTKIEYTVKGKEEPVDSIAVRLDYFSLPLLLKVSTPKGRFYAIGGMEGAYLLSSSQTSHNVEEDLDVTVKDFNIALHFGAGIHVPVGFPRLFFEVRYTQGLVNLTDDPIDNMLPRVKTNGFKVFAGIEIPLKKQN